MRNMICGIIFWMAQKSFWKSSTGIAFIFGMVVVVLFIGAQLYGGNLSTTVRYTNPNAVIELPAPSADGTQHGELVILHGEAAGLRRKSGTVRVRRQQGDYEILVQIVAPNVSPYSNAGAAVQLFVQGPNVWEDTVPFVCGPVGRLKVDRCVATVVTDRPPAVNSQGFANVRWRVVDRFNNTRNGRGVDAGTMRLSFPEVGESEEEVLEGIADSV